MPTKFVALKGSFDDFKTEIGLAVIPAVERLLAVFQDLWQRHGPAVQAFLTETLIPAISKVIDAFGALLSGEFDFTALIPEPVRAFWDALLAPIVTVGEAIGDILNLPSLASLITLPDFSGPAEQLTDISNLSYAPLPFVPDFVREQQALIPAPLGLSEQMSLAVPALPSPAGAQFTGPLPPALIEEEFTAIQLTIQGFLDWAEANIGVGLGGYIWKRRTHSRLVWRVPR